jgi:uncharacterized membrane protein (UPF0127 family)
MRLPVFITTLLFVTLLFVPGCGGGGEKDEASSEGTSETTSEQASQETTAEAVPDETAIVGINTARGERVEVRVEIADEEAEQKRGLMERTALAEDAGMLFVFPGERPRSFWMRNTLIPLSIAYIDGDGGIVDIQDMEPLDESPHPSAAPAQYALEVNQGFFEERGVRVGDEADLPVSTPGG